MNENQVIDYTQRGIEKGLIKIMDDGKRIQYVEQNKCRLYINPEEQLQAKAAQILANAKMEHLILGE